MSTPGILFSDKTNKKSSYDSVINESELNKIINDTNKINYVKPSNAYYNFNDNTLNYASTHGSVIQDSNYNAHVKNNNHMNEIAYTLQEEMSIEEFDLLLKLVKGKYDSYNISASSLINYVRKNGKIDLLPVAHHLLFQINEQLLLSKKSSIYHPFVFFKINKIYEIKNVDGDNKSIFAINISRKNKINNFILEIVINYSLNKEITVNYESIILKGIDNDYEFEDYKRDKISPSQSILENIFNTDLDYNKEIKNINKIIRYNKKAYGQYLESNKDYSDAIMLYPDSACFILDNSTNKVKELPDIYNPIQCKSYHKKYSANGVWDNKCTKDSDCPFNSPNTKRGGCDKLSGKCDMPVGITRIGYRKYLKDSVAKCNNCPVTNQHCCLDDKEPNYKFI